MHHTTYLLLTQRSHSKGGKEGRVNMKWRNVRTMKLLKISGVNKFTQKYYKQMYEFKDEVLKSLQNMTQFVILQHIKNHPLPQNMSHWVLVSHKQFLWLAWPGRQIQLALTDTITQDCNLQRCDGTQFGGQVPKCCRKLQMEATGSSRTLVQ